jgi:hypothetical protein
MVICKWVIFFLLLPMRNASSFPRQVPFDKVQSGIILIKKIKKIKVQIRISFLIWDSILIFTPLFFLTEEFIGGS